MSKKNQTARITSLSLFLAVVSSVSLFDARPVFADVRSDVEAKLIDTQKKAAPDLKVGKATCPVALSKPANKLVPGVHRCTVLVEGVSVPYDVTLRTGGAVKGGSFTMQNAKAVIDTKKLIAIAATVVDDPSTAKISCGKARVVVAAPGATLECTVVDGEATEKLTFAVKDLRGVVSLVS